MTDLLEDLKNTILDLIEDLKDNVFTRPDEEGDLEMVEFFFKRLHPKRIMDKVIKKVLPHEESIEKRDVKFFEKEKNMIFGGLEQTKVDHYCSIITVSNRVDKESRAVIWEYFDIIVDLANAYRR